MTKTIDFYFDYGSPTSYLAAAQLKTLKASDGVTVNHHPILLGGIYLATGNKSPMEVPTKRAWMLKDMAFFADRYEVPMVDNPHFPINTLNLMRGAIYAKREGFLARYSDAVFQAIWADGKNLGDLNVLREVLAAADIDADKLFAGTQDPAVKEELKSATAEAVAKGMFGAPVVFVGDRMFFGQDRVPFAIELATQSHRSREEQESP